MFLYFLFWVSCVGFLGGVGDRVGVVLRFLFDCFCLGLSNIIGVIVYILVNVGELGLKWDEEKKNYYLYGWFFYFGGLLFILVEVIGVLVVNIYIECSCEVYC